MNSEQKYSVGHSQVKQLLNYVESGEIAIPEIQRPFVWDAAKEIGRASCRERVSASV